eukprot:scaffold1800_cov237-Pinguiococcus_pyrenoidosus.AAC.14
MAPTRFLAKSRRRLSSALFQLLCALSSSALSRLRTASRSRGRSAMSLWGCGVVGQRKGFRQSDVEAVKADTQRTPLCRTC